MIENRLVLQNFYDGLIPMYRGHIDAAALMELRLSSIKWWPLKAGGEKENRKRNACCEGDKHAFCENRSFDQKTRGMNARQRHHDGHHLGHGLTHYV